MPTVAEPTAAPKPIRLDLDPQKHLELRIESAKLGLPMTHVLRMLVDEFIERQKVPVSRRRAK